MCIVGLKEGYETFLKNNSVECNYGMETEEAYKPWTPLHKIVQDSFANPDLFYALLVRLGLKKKDNNWQNFLLEKGIIAEITLDVEMGIGVGVTQQITLVSEIGLKFFQNLFSYLIYHE